MRRNIALSPGRFLILSIFIMVALGTVLLSMPFSQKIPIKFIDCLFTATSATCVTGLLTISFNNFTLIGKTIILMLIQVGGIGLLTISLILVSLFTNLGLATQLMFGQVIELESWKDTKKILLFIGSFTLTVEALGALVIFFLIKPYYTTSQALFHALFHSISSFCNAGLSSFGNSMIVFQNNIPMLFITGLLILCGSLGFITWYELFSHYKIRLKTKKKYIRTSLTTKIIFTSTLLIISITTLLLFALEWHQSSSQSLILTASNMFFNAISYRSAGLTTIDIHTLSAATILLIMIVSFIGSSPGSAGSGIKVTTFTVVVSTIYAALINHSHVDIKKRQIPFDQVFKALAVAALSFSWILISTFILLILNKQANFLTLLFESVSSFSNLGLSTGLTPSLSTIEKFIIILNMFFGRVGSITLVLALRARRARKEKIKLHYPEERPMIG